MLELSKFGPVLKSPSSNFLPVGQYPSDEKLLQIYPNPKNDPVFAKTQYDADRNKAIAQTNSLNTQQQLQVAGLPTPANPKLQKKMVEEGVTGKNVSTTFNSNQLQSIILGRSAPQLGEVPVFPKVDGEITEHELKAAISDVIKIVDFFTTDGETVGGGYGYPERNLPTTKRSSPLLRPSGYYKERINWEVTTMKRRYMGEPSIKFFVNPNSINYDLSLTQSLDQVQRGYFLNVWKDYYKQNFFPLLRVGFQFQSSNLLPESYKGEDDLLPPGLSNFMDLMAIFNEDRIIDSSDLDPTLGEESLAKIDGTPNYVQLSISTRIFPQMMMYGFFTDGLKFDEKAMDPLKFETNLQFLAFKTDPPWWDIEALRAKYNSFWGNYFNGNIAQEEIVPVTAQASTGYTSEDLEAISSATESRTSDFLDSELMPPGLDLGLNLRPREEDPVCPENILW